VTNFTSPKVEREMVLSKIRDLALGPTSASSAVFRLEPLEPDSDPIRRRPSCEAMLANHNLTGYRFAAELQTGALKS
jgi:hypothetical protein